MKINNINGIIIVPKRSIWAKGLRVSLPSIFAVGSPSLLAINPWDNSWNVIATRTGSADSANCLRIPAVSKAFP